MAFPGVRRKSEKLSHRNALSRLKSLGFASGVIYDIGACHGGWTRLASEVFQGAQFRAVRGQCRSRRRARRARASDVIAALGAADDDPRAFHVPRASDVTGASLYVEKTAHYKASDLDLRELATVRLDTLVARERLAAPDFVKIDVQGAELDVLAGAQATLRDYQALIVEVSLVDYNRNAPLIADVIAALDRAGFRCADICELHRTPANFVLQLDLLLVRPALFAKYHAAAGVAP